MTDENCCRASVRDAAMAFQVGLPDFPVPLLQTRKHKTCEIIGGVWPRSHHLCLHRNGQPQETTYAFRWQWTPKTVAIAAVWPLLEVKLAHRGGYAGGRIAAAGTAVRAITRICRTGGLPASIKCRSGRTGRSLRLFRAVCRARMAIEGRRGIAALCTCRVLSRSGPGRAALPGLLWRASPRREAASTAVFACPFRRGGARRHAASKR